MVEITWQLMMGIGLAASAGLRAFLPLLVVGVAARVDLLPLSARFEWLESTEALIVLAAAVLMEVVADKVPAVDHFLDASATLVRPVAGAVATASPLAALDPVTGMVVGIVLGGAVAGGVHVAKSAVRVVSTSTTAGIGNPVLSVGEDAASLAGSVLSIFVPVVTFAAAIAILYVACRVFRRRGGACA